MHKRTDKRPRVACLATQGSGSQDEDRIRRLLDPLRPELIPLARSRRFRGILSVLRRIRDLNPDLVVMEGTGLGGGIALLLSRLLDGRPYVISSGDAVAPFLSAIRRPFALPGLMYELALCRLCSGFIGWSPYLVGRALTMGAPRAMTAPNWTDPFSADGGPSVRQALGIPSDALVFGIVGSLNWNARYGYCYGLELVRAALRVDRDDLCVLIVGDGDGRHRLSELADDRLGVSIFLPGAVPRQNLGAYLAAIDVASLPQSVDQVGSFRYTTKISEYLAARLPIVTGQIPLSYDLDDGFVWRLPGEAPWDERYLSALSHLMESLTRAETRAHQSATGHAWLFNADRQARAVTEFILDILDRERHRVEVTPAPLSADAPHARTESVGPQA
jgi:glycosyltransferase involved in cell wall biosynthesis